MKQFLGLTAIVVRDYDEALQFYVHTLGFYVVEDKAVPEQSRRWVVVAPQGSIESRLLLARAVGEEQESRIGNQTGDRVFLFLCTDDFWRDYHMYKERGVEFVRDPKEEDYGTVAVFRDLYGNLWDLLQPKSESSESGSGMQIRHLSPDDYSPLIAVIDAWWGRSIASMLPKLFFAHFHQTSFVVINRDERIGFLVGFLSPARTDEAYVHFVGVHPDYRGQGVARAMYERFFQMARRENRTLVRCVTSSTNKASIAFHRAIGFAIEESDNGSPELPIHTDYDGIGESRVLFVKKLD